jgi:hypothetical protein
MPSGDCERLVDGFLAQPVNAVSSLAFVLVGTAVMVWRRGGRQAVLGWIFGLVLVLVGLGSLAFHGPGGTIAGWAHDASITALLILIVAVEIGHRAGWSTRQIETAWAVAAAGLVLVEGAWPMVADPLNAPLAFVAVLGVVGPRVAPRRSRLYRLREGRRRAVPVGVVILGTGALIMLLSRTGGPFCAPDALVQGHAIWHVLAATGTGIYAVSVSIGV